jgi:hypothetical protein
MDELERILKRKLWELASSVLRHPQRSAFDRPPEPNLGVGLSSHYERMFP